MSLAKSLAGFIVSSLFIISLYLTISSYTLGDSIQKDNIKSFIQTQTIGKIISQSCDEYCDDELNNQKCEEHCNYITNGDECKKLCLSETERICIECLSKFNESKQQIYNTIDEIYSNKIIDDISLDDITSFLKNTLIFLALSIIFGILIFFVSDKPLSKLGNKLVLVSIFLLSMVVIPLFIITPDIPALKLVSDYILKGFEKQILIGIVLMVIGIILIVIGKKVKLKKGSKEKEKVEKKKKEEKG